MAVVAAWKIHNGCKGNLSQLEFLQSVVTVLMKTENVNINYNWQGPCKYVNVDERFDNINHYIEDANKHNPHAKCVRKMLVTTV